MKITFAEPGMPRNGAVCVLAAKDAKLLPSAAKLDQTIDGGLTRAVDTSRFKGKRGEILEILSPGKTGLSRLLLIGLGDPKTLTERALEEAFGGLMAKLLASGEKKLSVVLDVVGGMGVSPPNAASHIAEGLLIRSYRFDKYRTKEPKEKKPSLKEIVIHTRSPGDAAKQFGTAKKVIEGLFLTRDLISEPANVVHPESFAARIKELEADGLEIEILGEKKLEKIGMRALLGVGQGSAYETHVAIMRWNGGPKGADDKPLALVGKGVTFDTGGISLKPGEGMEEMKWDMGGAGIVVGTMKALARRKAKANVIGIVGLVENMPSSTAQRPGDVVKSLSGQTIEIINTDAEGRLVLADLLWYCQDRFKPSAMIDLATLTGAILVTFGREEYAGYFTDDEKISDGLFKAGDVTGDKLWRLPLAEAYDRMIDTPIADMKNIGGRMAGSITAAQFLKRFTNKTPWAHIDVAGMVWALKDNKLWAKGATGYGVRLLNRFIADNYEGK